jgi:outer membrane protein assembly factor BamE (lipoprotein component of BamABCDE complex)
MSPWKVHILLGLSLCCLPGCITFYKYSGTEIKTARVAQIQPGKTLKREALEWFGAPMTISNRGDSHSQRPGQGVPSTPENRRCGIGYLF